MPEIFMDEAVRWAIDAKLTPPFDVSRPERVDYQGSGYGYQIVIREQAGKCRIATAKFSADGSRSLWTMDSSGVTG
jgi:hypothetical protein